MIVKVFIYGTCIDYFFRYFLVFIKADVISYEDLIANGSMTAARDKGLVRSEGKEYVMQDGDIVNFLFNVKPISAAGPTPWTQRPFNPWQTMSSP